MFTRLPDAGVPSAGVVRVGLVSVLLVSVSVDDSVTMGELVPLLLISSARCEAELAHKTSAPARVPVGVVPSPKHSIPALPAAHTLAAGGELPVEILVADATPNVGVTKVGLVLKTFNPVPVEVVRAAAKFALDGVARNVATPVAKPLTPVLIGRPVALVSVPLDGVPSAPPLTKTAAPPTCTVPLPLAAKERLTFVSDPVAPTVTVAGFAVAAFVMLT